MENLLFDSGSFDVVACAGSLSYGDPQLVDAEVRRVLRPGGIFISVDSLNMNPIYRLNRWIHFMRGGRSLCTLRRMPTVSRLDALRAHFDSIELRYFGALTWAMPVLARIIGSARAAAFSDEFDRLIDVKESAYKFVLVATGLR
jgi:SAM-dependent methyltransferase